MSAYCRRLATKPGTSRCRRTGVLPAARAQASSCPSVAGAVAGAATISTSSMSSGGLNQCSAAKRDGSRRPSPSAASGSEEVLVVRIASGGVTCSARASSSRLTARSSTTDSATSAAPSTASSASATRAIRSPAMPAARRPSPPCATSRSRPVAICRRARSRVASRRPNRRTADPASAKARAMPVPIVPAPRTPTRPGGPEPWGLIPRSRARRDVRAAPGRRARRARPSRAAPPRRHRARARPGSRRARRG